MAPASYDSLGVVKIRPLFTPSSLGTFAYAVLVILLALAPLAMAQEAPLAQGDRSRQAPPSTFPNPNAEWERLLQLQVFLDRSGFGPGKIDAKGGEFTTKAIIQYQKAHGLEADGKPESIPLAQAGPALTEYTITAEDENRIGPAPKTPREQSRLKQLSYRSVLEMVSEKFHTTEQFLLELNPQLKASSLKAGDRLQVPRVQPFEISAAEALRTEEEQPEAKKLQGGPWLDINVREKMLQVKEGDRVLAAFPITPGSAKLPAPKGNWYVQTITFMPKFRYDKAMLLYGRRSSGGIVTPPGPNNKVGVVWMNLNKRGVGIHGTDEPETIGRTTSHGCIRLSNWDVVRVAAMIQPGAKATIR